MNARGAGSIEYKEGMQDKVIDALSEWKRNGEGIIEIFGDAGWEYDPDGSDGMGAFLYFEYGRFDDHAQELLEAIAPLVERGHIEMTTEYDEYFQLAFVNGELEEYSGVIIYPGSPYADPNL